MVLPVSDEVKENWPRVVREALAKGHARGLTLMDIARELGVSDHTLRAWARGAIPKKLRCLRAAVALGIRPEHLPLRESYLGIDGNDPWFQSRQSHEWPGHEARMAGNIGKQAEWCRARDDALRVVKCKGFVRAEAREMAEDAADRTMLRRETT